jgi:hypothetical protein
MTRQPAKLAVGAGLEAWWDLRGDGFHPFAINPFRLVIHGNDA